jgi:hypothetical protein
MKNKIGKHPKNWCRSKKKASIHSLKIVRGQKFPFLLLRTRDEIIETATFAVRSDHYSKTACAK